MNTYYVSFGVATPFSAMMLAIKANSREDVINGLHRANVKFCEVYEELPEFFKENNHTIVESKYDAYGIE